MLEIRNLTKIYNSGDVNELCLFKDFSLTVGKGEFVSVVGSNGSGKTSLLNLICGSISADGGSILLDGEPLLSAEHKNYKRIGRVYQNPAHGTAGELTVMENLVLAQNKNKPYGLSFGVRHSREAEYRRLLSSLGLGLEEKLHAKASSLSGGQRQALALLLCTMSDIQLLILDEHTAALDPKSAEAVMRLTDRIVRERGISAIMVTHNLRYAVEYGDRLLMMHKGEAVIDISGEEKRRTTVEDLLGVFTRISAECGN